RCRAADYVYFFFQAEDGIRDRNVTEFRRVLFRSWSLRHTGVMSPSDPEFIAAQTTVDRPALAEQLASAAVGSRLAACVQITEARSEERRVGQEWSARGEADQLTRRRAG